MAQKRWTTIQSYWTKEYTMLWLVPGLILGGVIGFLVGIASTADVDTWFIDGFWPELLGTAMTIVIIDRLVDYRSQIRETKRHQKRLIRQAKGQSNELAKVAIDEMRDEGWLTVDDGEQLLKGAKLWNANLQDADLYKANLQGAELIQANLQGAMLDEADLQETDLSGADLQSVKLEVINLQGANLSFAVIEAATMLHPNFEEADLSYSTLKGSHLPFSNLQSANLEAANLENTNLVYARLQQANFSGANLQGVILRDASLRGAVIDEYTKFNEKTVLPDARSLKNEERKTIFDKYWTPETDMSRYTDPNHPDFWQPDWVKEKKD